MGVNSLPKTVTRQRRSCDLNPSPSAPESSTLTTRLPIHPHIRYITCGKSTWKCSKSDVNNKIITVILIQNFRVFIVSNSAITVKFTLNTVAINDVNLVIRVIDDVACDVELPLRS